MVAVQRGKERIRVETRIVVPSRDPVVTARVEAQYLPADKEIQIVSRTITEMRVTFRRIGFRPPAVERSDAGEVEGTRLLGLSVRRNCCMRRSASDWLRASLW